MTGEADHEREVLAEVTADVVRHIVFDSDAPAQRRFLAEFSEEVNSALEAIAKAHSQRAVFGVAVRGDLRSATVETFLHSAIYSLIAAFHHLVRGYPIGAGHMMRHYLESFSMAALCIDSESQVLEAFTRNRRGYRVDQAPQKMLQKNVRRRLQTLLGFDPDAWAKHLKGNWDFSGRSHSAGLTLAFQIMLETESLMVLGGEFDPAKRHVYVADLLRIRAGADNLTELERAACKALPPA
jgi:hypothetical protein